MPLSLGPNESAAYRGNMAPPPHLDLITAVGFRALGAALRLDVFATLAAGPLTAEALAGKLNLDPTGLRQLADLLTSLGYLTRSGDTYDISPISRRWLLRDAPGSYAPVVALWQDLLFGMWDTLETSLRNGTPTEDFYPWLAGNPAAHAEFTTMLAGQARWLSDEIIELVPLPDNATRLLDIGGGHAHYTTAFCRAHPGLSATVIDLPAALPAGERTIADAGLADRVTLTPGDWRDTDLGSGHDVVLLFNLLHGHNPEQNAVLLAKVAAALRPGGTLAILDHLTEPSPTGADSASDEAFAHAFSLNLFHTQGGRIYPHTEIDAWLSTAGFTTPTWTALRKLPSLHVACATRESAR